MKLVYYLRCKKYRGNENSKCCMHLLNCVKCGCLSDWQICKYDNDEWYN